jgi:hypothetical protein
MLLFYVPPSLLVTSELYGAGPERPSAALHRSQLDTVGRYTRCRAADLVNCKATIVTYFLFVVHPLQVLAADSVDESFCLAVRAVGSTGDRSSPSEGLIFTSRQSNRNLGSTAQLSFGGI